MYFIPRLIGVSTYSFVLFFIYFLVKRTNIKTNKALCIYVFIITFMGLFFVMNSGSDLFRLVNVMELFSSLRVYELEKAILRSSTPGAVLYFAIIGKLKIDGFLPAITGFLTYSFCFIILNGTSKKINSSRNDIAVALLLFMSRGLLIHVISGIRNQLSFSIITFCIYREFIKDKSFFSNIILYLVAISLHTTGQLFFIYKVLFLILEKNNNKFFKIEKLLFSASILIVIFAKGKRFIDSIIYKGLEYYSYGKEGTGYFYFWEGLLSAIAILTTLYLLIKFKKCKYNNKLYSKDIIKLYNYFNFMLPLTILNVFLIFVEFSMFHRTSTFLIMLDIPLSLLVLKYSDKEESKRIRNHLKIISLIMLFISCSRGNLSSLKFFE